MATSCMEIIESPKLQTKFTIELRPQLVQTLREWFERSETKSLDELVEQIVESTIAEFRMECLPPRDEEPKGVRHSGHLSRAVKAEIVDLFLTEEECSIVQLAVRFGIGRT
ncbi:MAG: hypothetical protein WBW58_08750, partial [Candidatus Acidiferrum sp.]